MNNEQDILRRAQQGDSEAFRLLVEAYQTQVYRLALRMCGEAAADDVTQEAFLAAWRALPEFRGTCRFSTWLYRLTTNTAIDWLRREKRHRGMDDVTELELPDDGPGPQDQAEQAEAQQTVRRALSRLSEEHRQVLLLRYMQELDYAEIAAALEISEGTVSPASAGPRCGCGNCWTAAGTFLTVGPSYRQRSVKGGSSRDTAAL